MSFNLNEEHNLYVASHMAVTIIMLRRAEIADLEHLVPPFEVGMVRRITTGLNLNGSKWTYPIGSE